MKRASSIALQSVVSLLILGGLVKAVFDNEQRRIPSWAASAAASPDQSAACSAILKWLHSQPWAAGDSFAILHASRVYQDRDRFGDSSKPANVVMVSYLRTLKDPDSASAPPSPLQFVFVLNDAGEVVRRLPVDGKHSPYADLFGL